MLINLQQGMKQILDQLQSFSQMQNMLQHDLNQLKSVKNWNRNYRDTQTQASARSGAKEVYEQTNASSTKRKVTFNNSDTDDQANNDIILFQQRLTSSQKQFESLTNMVTQMNANVIALTNQQNASPNNNTSAVGGSSSKVINLNSFNDEQ